MGARLGLREIERKAWLRTFEHGLWDLAVGLLILSFGIGILTGLYWMTAIWVPLAVPVFRDLAKRLIVPRLGHVTFRRKRQRSTFRVQIVLTALAVAGLAMFLLTSWSTRGDAPSALRWMRTHMLAVIGLIWGSGLVAGGWAADFPRLYVYGALLFSVLLGSDLGLSYNMGEGLAGIGSLITLVGLGLFVRFLRKYLRRPEPSFEEGEGDG